MFERLRPLYAKKFRCITGDCEDTCCRDWEVTLDRATYEKYASHPAMQPRMKECFTLTSEGSELGFARINFTASSTCPFLSPEHLCVIHRDLGEGYLSEACTTYPRISRRVDGLIEKPLVLSCPEAARVVLLNPELLPGYRQREGDRGYDRLLTMANAPVPRALGALRFFWEIREFCLVLLQDPTYLLWQRLFILGMFCKKLNELAGDAGLIPPLLREYARIAVDGGLKDAMNGIPVRSGAQVRMVLEVVDRYLSVRSLNQPRLRECLHDFLDGIHGVEARNVEVCTRHYAEAYANYYARFMEHYPQLMENFLINHIFHTRFPFSERSDRTANSQTEYVFLCLEYAILKGLLIGMAAHYRDDFSLEHVVKLTQSVVKALEHNNPLRDEINWAGLAEPISMAALLRN